MLKEITKLNKDFSQVMIKQSSKNIFGNLKDVATLSNNLKKSKTSGSVSGSIEQKNQSQGNDTELRSKQSSKEQGKYLLEELFTDPKNRALSFVDESKENSKHFVNVLESRSPCHKEKSHFYKESKVDFDQCF